MVSMLIALLFTLFLAALAGAALLLGTLVVNAGRALERVIDQAADEILDHLDENLIQHQATRGYLVEVLERKLLPHVGYLEPQRPEAERRMLQHANDMFGS
jgi:ABC-type transporter MlaC component